MPPLLLSVLLPHPSGTSHRPTHSDVRVGQPWQCGCGRGGPPLSAAAGRLGPVVPPQVKASLLFPPSWRRLARSAARLGWACWQITRRVLRFCLLGGLKSWNTGAVVSGDAGHPWSACLAGDRPGRPPNSRGLPPTTAVMDILYLASHGACRQSDQGRSSLLSFVRAGHAAGQADVPRVRGEFVSLRNDSDSDASGEESTHAGDKRLRSPNAVELFSGSRVDLTASPHSFSRPAASAVSAWPFPPVRDVLAAPPRGAEDPVDAVVASFSRTSISDATHELSMSSRPSAARSRASSAPPAPPRHHEGPQVRTRRFSTLVA